MTAFDGSAARLVPLQEVELHLHVEDAGLVASLEARAEGRERNEFALTALRIGAQALEQAAGQVDATAVRQEGERLMGSLESLIKGHERVVDEKLTTTLKDYFDPESGRLNERIELLLKDGGQMESLMRKHIAAEDSTLSGTLEAYLGKEGRLQRALDPEQSEGVVGQLKSSIEGVVRGHRDGLVSEFSLDNPEGALSRLVKEIEQKTDKSREALSESVESVVGEFSLDNEDSALSKLVTRVEDAQHKIGREFSLDNEGSALARMKGELEKLFAQQQKKSDAFQQEVTTAIAELNARREERDRSTRHGEEFETELALWLEREGMGAGDLVERTGSTTGQIRHCKKGDLVVQLGPDHRAAGARIVVEAKQDQSYTLAKAAAELEEARKNRSAGVGLFVFSARSAPAELDSFARRGDDVFVSWDAADPDTDVALKAALELARAMVAAGSGDEQQDLDREAIEGAATRIEAQLSGLDEVKKSAETICSGGNKILERVRIMRGKILKQIEALRLATGKRA